MPPLIEFEDRRHLLPTSWSFSAGFGACSLPLDDRVCYHQSAAAGMAFEGSGPEFS